MNLAVPDRSRWPETEPRPLHWEHSRSHWTAREVPKTAFKTRNTARDEEGHFTQRQTTERYNNINICITNNKARDFQKNIYFCFNDYAKAFDYVDHNCGTFLKRQEYHTKSDLPPKKSVCRSRSNNLNRTWTNGLVPNQERSTSKLCIITLLI